jgi:hypothetical protein
MLLLPPLELRSIAEPEKAENRDDWGWSLNIPENRARADVMGEQWASEYGL